MIEFIMYYNTQKGGNMERYQVNGHADDPCVCAAVSAVTQAAYMGLEEIHAGSIIYADSGCFAVSVSRYNKQSKAITRAMELGMVSLAAKYPYEIWLRRINV